MRLTTIAAVLTLAITATPRSAQAQEPYAWRDALVFHTFSIAAIDPRTGEVGVAVTTRVPCVGNGVPWVRKGVGAVATQASTRTEYGTELLDALARGDAPEAALKRALAMPAAEGTSRTFVVVTDGYVVVEAEAFDLIRKNLGERLQHFQNIDEVTKSPIPGLYEVRVNGADLAQTGGGMFGSYAIVEASGQQFWVQPNRYYDLDRLHAEVDAKIGELASRPLDRRRPLWELYLVEGLDSFLHLPPDSFAILAKVHHAAIDVRGGAEITTLLHDTTALPPHPEPPEPWFPESPPGSGMRLMNVQ